MSKLLSRMLAVLLTASLSFAAVAEQSNKGVSDGAQGEAGVSGHAGTNHNNDSAPVGEKPGDPTSQGSSAEGRVNENAGGSSGSTGEAGVSGRSGAGAGAAAGVDNNDSAPIGEKPSNPTSQGSSALDRVNENAGGSSGSTGEAGVSGRSGAAAGVDNNDSAPIGEKPGDPTSQGSSAEGRVNENAGGSSGLKRK